MIVNRAERQEGKLKSRVFIMNVVVTDSSGTSWKLKLIKIA